MLTIFGWNFEIEERCKGRSALCRSRRELSTEYLLAKIGVRFNHVFLRFNNVFTVMRLSMSQNAGGKRQAGKLPPRRNANTVKNWNLLERKLLTTNGAWYSWERAPGRNCKADRSRRRCATNFSLWLLHYRLTILESFESLRQHTWSLHTFENKSLSKWDNVYNWNISIDLHIFSTPNNPRQGNRTNFYTERFRISTQCYTIIWLLAYFFWCQRLVASAIGKHTDEKERKHVISTLTNQKIFLFFTFSVSFLSHIFLEKRRF